MTQAEFLTKLERGLSPLSIQRRQEILEDIRLHYTEGQGDGVEEEALSNMLGTPEALAREYRAQFALERAKTKMSAGNMARAIWAGIGMGMLNLLFMLPLGIGAFALWLSILISGIVSALGGLAAALLVIIDALLPLEYLYIDQPAAAFFASIACCALGLLLVIGAAVLGKTLGQALLRYIQANLDILSSNREEKK